MSYTDGKNFSLNVLRDHHPELDIFDTSDSRLNVRTITIMCKADQSIVAEFTYDLWSCSDRMVKDISDAIYKYERAKAFQRNVQVAGVFQSPVKPRKCECCGAPLPKGTEQCEYGGTLYY